MIEGMSSLRFPIRFERAYGVLSSALLLPPSSAYVEIEHDHVHVQMAWAFRCDFPRTAIASTAELDMRPISRGVHGWAGRWLVNGSGRGILRIALEPSQRAFVLGFPIRLRELLISVAEPAAVASALVAA